MQLVIVGNGGAAVSAIRTIRCFDRALAITCVSREPAAHYSPILLPYYIEGKISQAGLCHLGDCFYPEHSVRFIRGKAALGVDVARRSIILDGGERISYDRLLIATGASPACPPIPGAEGSGVLTLRTLADAERIRKLNPEHTAIVGTGPVAVELAIALTRRGKEVTLIGRSRVMRRIFSPAASERITQILIAHGINVLVGQQGIEVEPHRVVTATHVVDCDAIVVAAGVRPNTEFLTAAGIELGDKGGVVVDHHMRTSVIGVYAAGDCAQVPDFLTGEPVLNAIWPEAIEQGRIAALDILGRETAYRGGIPRNVINIFGTPVVSIGYQVGESDTRLFPGGWITIYKQDGRIVGLEIIGDSRRHGYLPVVYKRSVHPDWLRQAADVLHASPPRLHYRSDRPLSPFTLGER